MYTARKPLKSQESYDWTWNVMPLLIVTAALIALFVPQGRATADTAAATAATEATGTEATDFITLIVPAPQPGEGEPECVPAEMAQSY